MTNMQNNTDENFNEDFERLRTMRILFWKMKMKMRM